MQSIAEEITRYKTGDNNALEEILHKMEPLVLRYAKKTFSLEFEDAKQEYYIAIIRACRKIKTCKSDAQCLAYLKLTVKNKYCNFCKIYYSTPAMLPIDEELSIMDKAFDRVLLDNDIHLYFLRTKDRHGYKKKKLYFSYVGMSDAEIGKRLGITRQYVYLLKHKLAQELKSEYFTLPK